MTESLANAYAFIKRYSSECNSLYNANISYINRLEDPSKKYIFVFREGKLRSESPDNELPGVTTAYNKSPSKRYATANLDLTGSPLKDECDMDAIDMSQDFALPTTVPWSPDEESYNGIPVERSRAILSQSELQRLGIQSNAAVWILCDGKDEESTFMQKIEFSDTTNCRGLVTFRGIKPTSEANVSELMKRHSKRIPGCKVDTTIDSFFTINPSMTLKLSTPTTSIVPNVHDFRNCETVLHQTIRLGDSVSVANYFWQQLWTLSIVRNNILDYKRDDHEAKEAVYRCGIGIEMDILREKVIAAVTSLSPFVNVEQSEDSCEIEATIQRAKTKESLDITDKLWEILKECSSYKDLKAAFNIVFQCAAKCNIVNPPTNNNRLAEMIREVSEHRLAIPCLTGSEPLELLLEIGLEKLAKDYEYIFTESKICGMNDLAIDKSPAKNATASTNGDTTLNVRKSLYNAMQSGSGGSTSQQRSTLLHTNSLEKSEDTFSVGFQNSRFNQKEIDYKLSRLAQIHSVLEHLLQIQVNLNLENVYNQLCRQLLSRPMQPFNGANVPVADQIEIPIHTDSIVARLQNKDPHARRIVMTSSNKFREMQTTFYFSMENIFPPGSVDGIESDEKEFIKENVYYCWEYLKISTNRR